MKDKIGERIKARRKALHLTQSELGKIVGVSKAAIGQWEAGKNKTFEEEKFELLVAALETSKDYLKTGKCSIDDYPDPHQGHSAVNEYKADSYLTITDKNEIMVIELMRIMVDFQHIELLDTCKKMAKDAIKFKKALDANTAQLDDKYISRLLNTSNDA